MSNRRCVVVTDSDHWITFTALVPDQITDENAAERINLAIEKAQADDPEEWNYETVCQVAMADGFELLDCITVRE